MSKVGSASSNNIAVTVTLYERQKFHTYFVVTTMKRFIIIVPTLKVFRKAIS